MFRKIFITLAIACFVITPTFAAGGLVGGVVGLVSGAANIVTAPIRAAAEVANGVVNAGVCAVTSILFGDCSSGSISALNGLNGATLDGGGAAEGLEVFEDSYRGNTYDSAIGMITGWTNFALPFVSVIAIVALIYAGFLYLTSFGNDEQSGKAKKIIIWVVLGIVLIISAYAIVNTLIETDNSGGESGTSVNVEVGGVKVDIN